MYCTWILDRVFRRRTVIAMRRCAPGIIASLQSTVGNDWPRFHIDERFARVKLGWWTFIVYLLDTQDCILYGGDPKLDGMYCQYILVHSSSMITGGNVDCLTEETDHDLWYGIRLYFGTCQSNKRIGAVRCNKKHKSVWFIEQTVTVRPSDHLWRCWKALGETHRGWTWQLFQLQRRPIHGFCPHPQPGTQCNVIVWQTVYC